MIKRNRVYLILRNNRWLLIAASLLYATFILEPCHARYRYIETEPCGIIIVGVDAGFDDYIKDFAVYKTQSESTYIGSSNSVRGLWSLPVLHISHEGSLFVLFGTEYDIMHLYNWAVDNQSTASASIVSPMDIEDMPPRLRIRMPSIAAFYKLDQSHSLVALFLPHSDIYAPEFPANRISQRTSVSLTISCGQKFVREYTDKEDYKTVYFVRNIMEEGQQIQSDETSHVDRFDTSTGPYMFWWSLSSSDQCSRLARVIEDVFDHPGGGRFSWRYGDEQIDAAIQPQYRVETHAYLVHVPESPGDELSPRDELSITEVIERVGSSMHLEVLAFCMIDGAVELLIFKGADQ